MRPDTTTVDDDLDPGPWGPWPCTATTVRGARCPQQTLSRHDTLCTYHERAKAGLFDTQPGAHNGT
jgi:hypothetical protein